MAEHTDHSPPLSLSGRLNNIGKINENIKQEDKNKKNV